MKNINIALIGLGPHAKRIYLHYIKSKGYNLSLVVDLESKYSETRNYLDDFGYKTTNIFTLKDVYKDKEHLPKNVSTELLTLMEKLNITHMMISTEPKAHNMYIEFGLINNIPVLTDKPITVYNNMKNYTGVKKVKKQYYNLLKLEEKSNVNCIIMCQRQYHKGYEYVKKILNDVVNKYQIPITYIDIYHCDGNWEMPHDMLKENHPYKYGYGKLFHSGYHFIDLLSDFIKINNQLPSSKQIKKASIKSDFFTPNDELGVCNIEDYKRIFNKQMIPEYYKNNVKPNFKKFGEKNYYSMIDFKNKYNQNITHVNLNLLHYGVSRRGWIESKDYYKNNGRIRHERINIQVGTLLNIQIHSYQSKEIKDRKNMELEKQVGGLEHFDIDIYRNVDIIAGKPFERITLSDLYKKEKINDFLGYNELSREILLDKFIKGKCEKGRLKDQSLAIELLSTCAFSLVDYYNGLDSTLSINMNSNTILPIDIRSFKQYSKYYYLEYEKEVKKIYNIESDDIEYNIIMNYIPNKNIYEVYLVLEKNNIVVGGLFNKLFNKYYISLLYFNLLRLVINIKNINLIKNLLELN